MNSRSDPTPSRLPKVSEVSQTPEVRPVLHGGNLNEAVRRYGIARERWCDLSTGINPHGYPIPAIDPQAWLRLPEDDDDLEAIAAQYYGARRTVAVAGTQAAIHMLPQLLVHGTVAIHALTYGEYAPAFEHAGFRVERFVDMSLPASSGAGPHSNSGSSSGSGSGSGSGSDSGPGPASGSGSSPPSRPVLRPGEPLPAHWQHLVIVNPNNPTTQFFDAATLRGWQAELTARGGTLIVDEAFADAIPEHSLASFAHEPGLIVLRSVGKFFGLAGARVGFMIAAPDTLDRAQRLRGPWSIAGPARAVVRSALLDIAWHQATRMRLEHESKRLETLLASHGLCVFRTPLFAWVPHESAPILHERLAKTAVWVRKFDRVPSLRLGLPADEAGWKALSDGLGAALR